VSAVHDGDPPGVAPPASDLSGPDAPLEEGAALYRIELRRVDDRSVATTGFGCEFAERLKVYFRSNELITKTCTNIDGGGLSGTRETTPLLDVDLERIRSAYDQLRPARGERCEATSEWLSLDVEAAHSVPERQWSDVEHSGCPLRELEGQGFVEGLGPLYRLLAELRAQ
jgi:hypothetical protein